MPPPAVLWRCLLCLALCGSGLLADTPTPVPVEPAEPTLWEAVFSGTVLALVSGVVGILLMALGFKVFDLAIDMPTACMIQAAPSTTKRAAAVMTSRAPVEASRRKNGFNR